MFSSDSTSAGSAAFTQDVFSDVTDTPSTNSGFSSTFSNNPLNNLYGNDDFPRFGPKTLWIKDLVLVQNKAFWINGEPTYNIVWHEPFPSAQGYVYGNFQLIRQGLQTFIQIRTPNDGFGVGGVFARCMFMMIGNTAAAGNATGTVFVDGVSNSTSVDWSNMSVGPASINTTQNPQTTPMYAASVHAGANETYNIHDFRLTANQGGGVFTIAGVVVYSENSTLSIDQFPGLTYNNKTQAKTSVNATLPLPTFGTSLGGRSVIYKTITAGYSTSTLGVSTINSIAQGNISTSILNVTTGDGSKFTAGQGIITASNSGATPYIGVIQSISTDALTVYPQLPFGVSSAIYTYFKAGQSLAINASLNILSYTYLGSDLSTMPFIDGYQKYCVWGNNVAGVTLLDNSNAMVFTSAAGFVQCEGYFSAAEIEWAGMSFAVLSGTMIVNGLPVFSHNNIGFTGVLKKTVFMDAGPGWNNFAFFPGSSHINVGLTKINMYRRAHDLSPTFGILAAYDTLQAFIPHNTNATFIPPGIFQRVFGDALLFKGPWVRAVGATMPGGIGYFGATTTCTLNFQYYGDRMAVVTGSSIGAGGSLTFAIDSGANLGATSMNTVIMPAGSNASLTFHSVSLVVQGGTVLISAIDFFRPQGEMSNIQTFSPVQPPLQINQMPAGSVIQVVQNWWNTTVTGGNTAIGTNVWWDIPGSAVNISPRSIRSKIYVQVSLSAVSSNVGGAGMRLCRNGMPIGLGQNSAGNTNLVSTAIALPANTDTPPLSNVFNYLDTPGDSSALTYKLQAASWFSPGTWINQSIADTADGRHQRASSSITLTEIAG